MQLQRLQLYDGFEKKQRTTEGFFFCILILSAVLALEKVPEKKLFLITRNRSMVGHLNCIFSPGRGNMNTNFSQHPGSAAGKKSIISKLVL